jgi:hypothetical protein
MEKYKINNLEDFAVSLADSIKRMSIYDLTEDSWSLAEEIAAYVRGTPYCTEIKSKSKKDAND